MGLNASKGNMYEWVTHTWNTVKGACSHDCAYCYMKRWGKLKKMHFDRKELKTDLGEANFIFVGSSCDLFADSVPREWIGETLRHCMKFGNRYLFQSKNPGNIGTFPELTQMVLDPVFCTTIETNRTYPDVMKNCPSHKDRADGMEYLGKIAPKGRYVTIEPIMDFDLGPMVELIKRCEPVQVNIGADSGGNNLPEPSFEKVIELVENLKEFTVIAKKKNLDRLGNLTTGSTN